MASLICQPCQNDDITEEAAGYCVDCAEYLCVTCYKYHCKPQPCRHHVLLDADNMPREVTSHVQSDTCSKHKGKVMEYHCNSHDYVGCSVCMTLDHTTCEGKSYIPDIATSIPESDEYKELQASVNDLINFADGQISVLNASLSDTEKNHDSVLDEVLRFRKKLNEAIDVLEDVVRDEARVLKDRNAKKEKDKIKACGDIKTELEHIQAELNMSIKYRQFMKLFIAIKSAKLTTSEMEARLKAIGSYEDIQFEFTPNVSILKLLNALETLGTVSSIRAGVITAKDVVRMEEEEAESSAKESDQSSAKESDQSSHETSATRPKSRSILKRSGEATTNMYNTKNQESTEESEVTTQHTNESSERILEATSVSVRIDVATEKFSTDGNEETTDADEITVSYVKNTAGIGHYMPSHSDEDDEGPELITTTDDKPAKVDTCASNECEQPTTEGEQESPNTKSRTDTELLNTDKKVDECITGKNDADGAKSESNTTDDALASRSQIKNPKERIIVFLKDIDVTSSEDTTVPAICGLASLEDDKIVVCDNENNSIKVVEILTNIVVQTIKSDQSPWDVCEAGTDRIAVTFPYSKQITIYTTLESVNKDYTLSVGGGCYGIAYANDNLFVAFGDTNVIKVMDLYGYVVRVLQNARGEKPIFNSPKHITAGPEGRLFYVANSGNDSVTCLTALGHVVGIFADRNLKGPRGLAVDSFGLVYVCNFPRPSCIQVLTKGLNKVKKLLNKDKSIVNPLSLSYGAKGDWLFIGLRGEQVKMFKLTV